MTSHQKNETHELLQFLTPHELAELETLAMPPDDAEGCVVMVSYREDAEAAVKAAEQKYIAKHGYAPPNTMVIQLVPADSGN